MVKHPQGFLFAAVLLSLAFVTAEAQQTSHEKAKSIKKTAPKGATYTVKASPFKVEVTLKGVFEAEVTSEVTLRPEVWSSLVVLKAVKQGTHVKKGETLVRLETRKIDLELSDVEFSRQLSDLSLRQAEEAFAQLRE